MTSSDSSYWDDEADRFDDEPDHGLRAATTRDAWRRLLLDQVPAAPADVVDLGSGTGTLSLLLATEGHRVRGLDFSTSMVEAARAKARDAGLDVAFSTADAAAPPFEPASCDVVLCRHVLWAMPDPTAALAAWIRLLRNGGRLVLIEGSWSTGAGIPAVECQRLLLAQREHVEIVHLTDPLLWGRPIMDERYLAVSLR